MHTLNPSSGLWPPALGRRATGPAASPDPYSKSHKLELVPAPNVSSCPTSQRPLSVKDLTSVNLTLLLWKAKLGKRYQISLQNKERTLAQKAESVSSGTFRKLHSQSQWNSVS